MTHTSLRLLIALLVGWLAHAARADDVEVQLGAGDGFSIRDSTGTEHFRLDETTGNVGIGNPAPAGRLHVESAVNSVGTVFRLPAISSLPDPNYSHEAVVQWEGGEVKFGKWRNYFNGFEQDWAITYNAPWNYTSNAWLGRDSGDSRANIAAFMRFNIAEGDSGRNVFAINFAPPGPSGTVPDWNAAAQYRFYDGRIQAQPGNPTPGPKPAEFHLRGAAEMEAMIHLDGHGSVDPNGHLLVSDKTNNFRIETALPSPAGPTNRTTRLLIDPSGSVGIGTETPGAKLEVAEGDIYASTPGSGVILVSPDGLTCKRIGIDNSGDLVATSVTCP